MLWIWRKADVPFLRINERETRDIRIHNHGIIGVIYHKAWLRSAGLFYFFFLDIVDFCPVGLPLRTVIAGESGSVLEGRVRNRASVIFQDHMRTGSAF